jgi:hypothetical protein
VDLLFTIIPFLSYYAPRGAAYGHQQLNDAIIKDGLWDAYNNIHMVRERERKERR